MWGSLHVYYDSDQDVLLTNWLAPLAQSLRRRGLVTRLFFLRYWDGGPHVRLRYLIASGQDGALVTDELTHEVERYMAVAPSTRTFHAAQYESSRERLASLEQMTASSGLIQNNTARAVAYEPELAKYGGEVGVAIAEELFDASTRAVLLSLPALHERADARVGLAIAMTLIAMTSFGIPPEEIPPFLRRYHERWTAYLSPSSRPSDARQISLSAARLAGQARNILRGDWPRHEAFGTWATAIAGAATAIKRGGANVLSRVAMTGPSSSEDERRAFLLTNYVHTHNNRLGVRPSEEAYLALVAASAVEAAA